MHHRAGTYVPPRQNLWGLAGVLTALLLGSLALGHIVVSRWVWWDLPLQTDAGIWAYIGRRMLDGAVLYRDLWESKPPGIYGVFAGVEWLFGDKATAALVWLDGALSAAILGATYLACRRHAGRAISALACLLCSVVLCHRVLADWGLNVEKFVALLETLAILVVLPAVESRTAGRRWFVMGALCGTAAMFKQTGLALAAAATLLVLRSRPPFAPPRRPATQLWAGALIVWTPVLAGLWYSGGLGGFVEQVLAYDVQRLGGTSEGFRLFTREHWASLVSTLTLAGVLLLPWAASVLRLGRASRTSPQSGLAENPAPMDGQHAWPGQSIINTQVAIILLIFAAAPHGYGHYLLQAAPPVAILLAWNAERLRHGEHAAPRLATIFAAAVLGGIPLADHFRFLVDGECPARQAYRAQSTRLADVVHIVRQFSAPGESVMLWPPDYAASYAANRVTPLECSNADVLFKGKAYRLAPPIQTILERLEANPPEIILDTTEVRILPPTPGAGAGIALKAGLSLLEDPDAEHPLLEGRLLARFKRWMRSHYGGQQRIGSATAFFRNQTWRPIDEVFGPTSSRS